MLLFLFLKYVEPKEISKAPIKNKYPNLHQYYNKPVGFEL